MAHHRFQNDANYFTFVHFYGPIFSSFNKKQILGRISYFKGNFSDKIWLSICRERQKTADNLWKHIFFALPLPPPLFISSLFKNKMFYRRQHKDEQRNRSKRGMRDNEISSLLPTRGKLCQSNSLSLSLSHLKLASRIECDEVHAN